MIDETDTTPWQEITGNVAIHPAQWARRSTPSQRGFQPPSTDRTPAEREPDAKPRFARAIGPCLALVVPVGMSQEDRVVWIDAAFTALKHLPIDLIEKGAAEARKTADHPSKIVPAIIAATRDDVAFRDRMAARPQPERALPAPGDERPTTDELDAICKRYGVGRYAKAAPFTRRDPATPTPVKGGTGQPGRTPTREDYIKLGVDPAVLDRMAAEKAA